MRCKLFHSWLCVWSVATLLYGATSVLASQPASGEKPAAGASAPQAAAAHIALLLPSNSTAFARSAEAVKNGFLAGAKAHGKAQLPIRLYPLNDDPQSALAAYREALAAGARVAVGPLTRNGVAALASGNVVAIPTLALNVPERSTALPPNLYTLSLHVEAEARQVARLAAQEGRVNAVTVFADTPLLRRIHQAFVDEFTRSGGRHVEEYAYAPDVVHLSLMRQLVAKAGADMAFLALDYPRGRIVQPYLGKLALYATSHIHPGAAGTLANFELANVRFMDMPWVLQPDHPAVMIYPRPEPPGSPDLDRLYALGIDAFRIAQGLLEGRREPLDGVTGRITPGSDRHFVRELTRARFADGKIVVSADTP